MPGAFQIGGPASFQHRLTAELRNRGITVFHDWEARADLVMLLGGTRRIGTALGMKRRGIRIIQRVDGMNWTHRARWPGVRQFARAELQNSALFIAWRGLANSIIYQSSFVRWWWETVLGPTRVPSAVIHNGVDLRFHSPHGERYNSEKDFVVALVEGHITEDQAPSLAAVQTAVRNIRRSMGASIELVCVGRVAPEMSKRFGDADVHFLGPVPIERVPFYLRGADVLVSLDVNPACPNSVIEALACGTPVVAFKSGAVAEVLEPGAGEVVPYGGNPWKLERPSAEELEGGIARVLAAPEAYAARARLLAERRFGLGAMADAYCRVFEETVA